MTARLADGDAARFASPALAESDATRPSDAERDATKPSSADRHPAVSAVAEHGRGDRPSCPPLYVVLTRVPRRSEVVVGALGTVTLERGWYAYVGSSRRVREARVARHLTLEKPLHWHADHLFAAFPAQRAWLVDGVAGECQLATALSALPGAERRPARFGAGDCRCAGHLVRFGRRPLRRYLAVAARVAGAPSRGVVISFP